MEVISEQPQTVQLNAICSSSTSSWAIRRFSGGGDNIARSDVKHSIRLHLNWSLASLIASCLRCAKVAWADDKLAHWLVLLGDASSSRCVLLLLRCPLMDGWKFITVSSSELDEDSNESNEYPCDQLMRTSSQVRECIASSDPLSRVHLYFILGLSIPSFRNWPSFTVDDGVKVGWTSYPVRLLSKYR